jgi:gas vesicle protein
MRTQPRPSTPRFDQPFITKVAAQFHLDPEHTRAALEHAEAEHTIDKETAAIRDLRARVSDQLAPFARQMARTAQAWSEVPDEVKLELSRYLSPSGEASTVKDHISQMQELLAEFFQHYRRMPGNQTLDWPLQAFAQRMKLFWEKEVGERFGQRLDSSNRFPLFPINDASRFFCKCARRLNPEWCVGSVERQ